MGNDEPMVERSFDWVDAARRGDSVALGQAWNRFGIT